MGLHDRLDRLERVLGVEKSDIVITEWCTEHPGHRCLFSVAYPEVEGHVCTFDGSLAVPNDAKRIELGWNDGDDVA